MTVWEDTITYQVSATPAEHFVFWDFSTPDQQTSSSHCRCLSKIYPNTDGPCMLTAAAERQHGSWENYLGKNITKQKRWEDEDLLARVNAIAM